MPLLNVKVIENVFTDEQKKQMVERLTDAMVSIEGENMRPVTWVVEWSTEFMSSTEVPRSSAVI